MAKENDIKDATNGDYNVKTDDYDPTTDAYSTIMSSLVPVCGQLLYLKPATDFHRWIVDKIDDLMFCWPITTPIIWVCIARCKIQLWFMCVIISLSSIVIIFIVPFILFKKVKDFFNVKGYDLPHRLIALLIVICSIETIAYISYIEIYENFLVYNGLFKNTCRILFGIFTFVSILLFLLARWKDLFTWIYTGFSLFYSSFYTNIVLQNLFTNGFIWTGTFLFLSRLGTHYLGADDAKYCTLACIMKDEIMSKPLSVTNIYHCNIFIKIDNINNDIREFFKNKIISTLVNDKINIQAEEEPQNMNIKNNLEAKIEMLEERISQIEKQNVRNERLLKTKIESLEERILQIESQNAQIENF
ncbi:87_t:CDS:1 [Gigaspora margarita]|uniref:87_t:CDS:1 n=1 Tax=Gigaspora margarita TaxID=4874 RepID=A0ABN7UG63_GIGMA|nr:87_t:CDS:1 [Gigaspora margarita]